MTTPVKRAPRAVETPLDASVWELRFPLTGAVEWYLKVLVPASLLACSPLSAPSCSSLVCIVLQLSARQHEGAPQSLLEMKRGAPLQGQVPCRRLN